MNEHTSMPSELSAVKNALGKQIQGEGQRLRVCCLWALALGLLAHGFVLTNLLIGHDSLNEFYWTASKDWKMTLGRFAQPVLRYGMGEITVLPWLTGLSGLLCIALSAHLVSKLFSLNTLWENLLLCGIMVTNVTVTAILATYIHDFAGDMLALLLCVGAAWAWRQMGQRLSWKHTLLGAGFLALSFGLYQAYLAVTATILCLLALQGLLRGKGWKQTLNHLLRALPMVILAGGAYLVLVWVSKAVLGLPASTGDPGNDLSLLGENLKNFPSLVADSYKMVVESLFTNHYDYVKGVHDRANSLVTLVNWGLLLLTLWNLGAAARERKLPLGDVLLLVALLLLLPLAMACVTVLSTATHTLVRYAFCLYYLLVLLALGERPRGKAQNRQRLAAAVLLGAVLVSNVQLSNAAYVKKDLEGEATLSAMTRVVARLESQPQYVPGQTPVAILGDLRAQLQPLKVGPLLGVSGLYNISPISSPEVMEDYFSIVLQCPICLVSPETQQALRQTDAYAAMEPFPGENSIATIDGVVVVKLSD